MLVRIAMHSACGRAAVDARLCLSRRWPVGAPLGYHHAGMEIVAAGTRVNRAAPSVQEVVCVGALAQHRLLRSGCPSTHAVHFTARDEQRQVA